MLQLLHIENIAIIECADIEFRPGFNALTGETGAGKSIVIDSIGAIFSICSKESIALPHFLPDSGSLQQLVDLLDELLRQIVIPHN